MTSPAYDIKPEAPMRTEIDQKLVNLLRDGERLWRVMNNGDPNCLDVIECLIGEAVETMSAICQDRPGGLKTAWPEMVAMTQEAIENARNIERDEAKKAGRPFDEDLYEYPRRTRAKPTAAAMSRFLPSMDLLKHIKAIRSGQQKARQAMVMAIARGLPFASVPDVFRELGYHNPDAARAAYIRSLRQIERGVKPSLPKDFAFDAPVAALPKNLSFSS